MASAFDILLHPVRSALAGLRRPHGLRAAAEGSSYVPGAEEYDRQRGTACKRGYDRQWRNVRAEFLEAHPYCRCGAEATIVDHKVKVRDAPHLRLVWSNLQGMCRVCHAAKTAAGL